MTPTWSKNGVDLYLGDCREILPTLGKVDAVITDPVWPNCGKIKEFDGIEPWGLFSDVSAFFPSIAERAVIQLGCNSDPRFLGAIPASMPFLRCIWLEYVRPHYLGRIMYTNDIAYVFGIPPKSRPGNHVLSGRFIQSKLESQKEILHPCPRHIEHVKWLVQKLATGIVLDPFMGSGTTGVACVLQGVPFIGVEVNEKYFCEAVRRIEFAMRQPKQQELGL